MLSRNGRQGQLYSVQNPTTIGALAHEKPEMGHDKETGHNGKMDSVSTSAMHEAAEHFSRSFANDKSRPIAGGRRRQLATTISSLDGQLATLNQGAWSKKFKRDRVRPKSSAGGGF